MCHIVFNRLFGDRILNLIPFLIILRNILECIRPVIFGCHRLAVNNLFSHFQEYIDALRTYAFCIVIVIPCFHTADRQRRICIRERNSGVGCYRPAHRQIGSVRSGLITTGRNIPGNSGFCDGVSRSGTHDFRNGNVFSILQRDRDREAAAFSALTAGQQLFDHASNHCQTLFLIDHATGQNLVNQIRHVTDSRCKRKRSAQCKGELLIIVRTVYHNLLERQAACICVLYVVRVINGVGFITVYGIFRDSIDKLFSFFVVQRHVKRICPVIIRRYRLRLHDFRR